MKKIGIVTINGNNNFGNRLQNYALQTFLEKKGFIVSTIWIATKKQYIKEKIKLIIIHLPFSKYRRLNRFIKFTNKNINIDYWINNYKTNNYNFFICGSDQVWNYNYPSFSNNMLLDFSIQEKNISYSSSFGVSQIDDKQINLFQKNLQNFKYLSVREDSGKTIVEELTNRNDIEVLIDPTMLLTAEEWDKVSIKPKNYSKLKKKKYMLNYFLGELSDERKKEIEKIAKKYDCEIINILDKNDPFYASGPSEFLYLEKHAFLICTDSFHSSVFAILYDRPFIIFDRDDNEAKINSRLDTLITKFKLKNRKYNGKEITNENLNHDYSEAYIILDDERKKSDSFLTKALDI